MLPPLSRLDLSGVSGRIHKGGGHVSGSFGGCQEVVESHARLHNLHRLFRLAVNWTAKDSEARSQYAKGILHYASRPGLSVVVDALPILQVST